MTTAGSASLDRCRERPGARIGPRGRSIRHRRRRGGLLGLGGMPELLPRGHLLVRQEALADPVGGLERAGRNGDGGVREVAGILLEGLDLREDRIGGPQLAQRLLLDRFGHAFGKETRVVRLRVERVEIDIGEVGLGELALVLRPAFALRRQRHVSRHAYVGIRTLGCALDFVRPFSGLDLAPRPALQERLVLIHSRALRAGACAAPRSAPGRTCAPRPGGASGAAA